MSRRYSLLAGWLLFALFTSQTVAEDIRFQIRFPESLRPESYSGRVYLFFAKEDAGEPRLGPDWFRPEPLVALDVDHWKPGESLLIDSSLGGRLLAYPKPFSELELAGYRVQAVARFNAHERSVGSGPGNGYSAVADVADMTVDSLPQELLIDRLVEARPFPENRWFKQLVVRSGLLSRFYDRKIEMRAAILLPASYYDRPEQRYPVIFEVPGFSGTHFELGPTRPLRAPKEPIAEHNAGGVEFLRVTLDPSCPLGHHEFADSENNGPVGTALITEFIPELNRQFRTIAAPTARFLTGHSSGGWSSLWLQVTYSELFGGTWSTAPDPVDFRDFQQINLYRPGENMYADRTGMRRPLARQYGQVKLWYDDFDHMEEVVGYGGQLHSFEAVFSPRGGDGRPVRVWDRKTGIVNTEVAQAWKKYDIRQILDTEWSDLGPHLAGKLHVFQGEFDTFYLDGATRLLKESLTALKSDAVVEIIPGKTHFDLLTPELRQRMRAEMVESFLKHHSPPQGSSKQPAS